MRIARHRAKTVAQSARTGAELLAFLRSSPLVGEDLDIERDPSTGRRVDLE